MILVTIKTNHWQLDDGFKEEVCRIRVDDRAEAFSRIRQVCLNLLNQETSFKGSIQRKRIKCAMDVKSLSKVLAALAALVGRGCLYGCRDGGVV
ncbi:hypothetical protein M3893_001951 [Vibrio metschnikovii]|nr:hypothetical protein [Vibrio metschnikovii]